MRAARYLAALAALAAALLGACYLRATTERWQRVAGATAGAGVAAFALGAACYIFLLCLVLKTALPLAYGGTTARNAAPPPVVLAPPAPFR
jgi:hypothetical protein